MIKAQLQYFLGTCGCWEDPDLTLFLIIEGEKMFYHAQEGIVRCPLSGRYTWVTRVADADANGRNPVKSPVEELNMALTAEFPFP